MIRAKMSKALKPRLSLNYAKKNLLERKPVDILSPKNISVFSRGQDLGYIPNINTQIPKISMLQKRNYSPQGPGSGAGRGGGSGGSIKDAGGGLGKYGAANEESYFYNKNRQEVEEIKKKLKKNPEKAEPDKKK